MREKRIAALTGDGIKYGNRRSVKKEKKKKKIHLISLHLAETSLFHAKYWRAQIT